MVSKLKEFRIWVMESIINNKSIPPNFDHALSKLIKAEINKSNKRIEDNVETVYKNANELDFDLFKKWYLVYLLRKKKK